MKALAWSIFLSTLMACVVFGPEIPEASKSTVTGMLGIGFVVLVAILVLEK